LEELDRAPPCASAENGLLQAQWRLQDGKSLILLANIGDQEVAPPSGIRIERPLWGGLPTPHLPPWAVFWGIGQA
jgi:hypothetical protein